MVDEEEEGGGGERPLYLCWVIGCLLHEIKKLIMQIAVPRDWLFHSSPTTCLFLPSASRVYAPEARGSVYACAIPTPGMAKPTDPKYKPNPTLDQGE